MKIVNVVLQTRNEITEFTNKSYEVTELSRNGDNALIITFENKAVLEIYESDGKIFASADGNPPVVLNGGPCVANDFCTFADIKLMNKNYELYSDFEGRPTISGNKESNDLIVVELQLYDKDNLYVELLTGQSFYDLYYSLPRKTKNDGGTTDYYAIQPKWKQCQDIIEAREMNFSQGNILKVAFTFNLGRHTGTDYKRDLKKIIWFAERELHKLK